MTPIQILLLLIQILPGLLAKIEEFGKAQPGQEKFNVAISAVESLVQSGAILPGIQWDTIKPIATSAINIVVAVYNAGVWKKTAAKAA